MIGHRLKTLRLLRNKSQEWLGEKLGITFQQVQKYEKGTNRISGSRILQICAVLKTTPNELLGWGEVSSDEETILQALGNFVNVHGVDAIQLMQEMTRVPPKTARSMFRLIEAFVAERKAA